MFLVSCRASCKACAVQLKFLFVPEHLFQLQCPGGGCGHFSFHFVACLYFPLRQRFPFVLARDEQ